MFRNLLLITTAAFVFNGCFWEDKKEEKWNSFIYPDKTNTKRNLKSPMTFASLAECKEQSQKQLATMNIEKTGTFKCGLHCEYHEGMKVEVCEKMLASSEN